MCFDAVSISVRKLPHPPYGRCRRPLCPHAACRMPACRTARISLSLVQLPTKSQNWSCGCVELQLNSELGSVWAFGRRLLVSLAAQTVRVLQVGVKFLLRDKGTTLDNVSHTLAHTHTHCQGRQQISAALVLDLSVSR